MVEPYGASAAVERRRKLNEIQLADRRATVIRMRNAGATLASIAEQLGVSPFTVSRDIELGLKSIMRQPAEEMIAVQRSIISDMRRANYVAMVAGDKDAAAVVAKTLEHEAKLFGLYAPQRVNLGIGSDEDFARQMVDMMRDISLVPPEELDRGSPVPGKVKGYALAINEGVHQAVIHVDDPDPDEHEDEVEPWVR